MSLQIAQQRIAEVKQNKSKALDLGGLGLETIPDEVWELDWLEELYLGYAEEVRKKPFFERTGKDKKRCNAVRNVPADIKCLPNLKHLRLLDLEANQLTALPESFGQMAGLQTLGLDNNKLTALPESFGQMAGLQELTLGYNKLTALPESFGQMAGLQMLDLHDNQLTALPESFGQMAGLQTLGLRGNQLTALPESFGQMAGLQTLNLDFNKLTVLPESIGQMAGLQTLNLDYNKLTVLPESIGQMAGLQTLGLDYNKLTALPESFGQMAGLQTLNLHSNQLTALPESFGQMAGLQTLNLDYNKLTVLPESIGQMAGLQTLNLDYNKLTALPESFGQMAGLQTLNLHSNQLTALPESFGQMAGLQELTLGYNKLTALPESFGQMAGLQTLNLDYNKLTALPESFGQMAGLQTLYLRDNQLTALPESIGQMAGLQMLDLRDNQLTALPESIGQMAGLQRLILDNNKLDESYTDALDKGIEHFLGFIRGLAEATRELYEAKLILTGEGKAGKTCLIKALRGDEDVTSVREEDRTYGVEIAKLKLPHPDIQDIELNLNSWDFGGQDIYKRQHVFFTPDAVYLLVYDPTGGDNDRKVESWLRMVHLYAGKDAKVILVATHCPRQNRKYSPDVDLTHLPHNLQKMIVAREAVDSHEGYGIEKLKLTIAEHAKDLPHMGNKYPEKWYEARKKIVRHARENNQNYMKYSEFEAACMNYGMPDDKEQIEAMAVLFMHGLGAAVYYADDENELLSNIMVLNAEWLTKAIVQVFESDVVKEQGGVLIHDKDLKPIWRDHGREDWQVFDVSEDAYLLELMRKFDISFVIPQTDRRQSLIAQLVPDSRPENLQDYWDDKAGINLSFHCEIDEHLPNLMPKLIVRTFADHIYRDDGDKRCGLYWRNGALLESSKGVKALFERFEERGHNILSLKVQGQGTRMYFWHLYHVVEQILREWPGLKDRFRFKIPCPYIHKNGEKCSGLFKLETLLNRHGKGKETATCDVCDEDIAIVKMLDGFEFESTQSKQIQVKQDHNAADIQVLADKVTERLDQTALMQQALYTSMEARCPRVFTLKPLEATTVFGHLTKLVRKKYEFTLYCEKELEPVFTKKITVSTKWLRKTMPFLKIAAGMFGASIPDDILKESLPGEEDTEHTPRWVEGTNMLILEEFMREHKIAPEYGGLKKLTLPDGNTYWLGPKAYKRHKHEMPRISGD